MNVIVVTTSSAKDPGVDMVSRALAARGAETLRLETDLFPTDRQLTIGWDQDDRILLSTPTGGSIDLRSTRAAWLRHTDTGDALPHDMDPDHRQAARLESDAMVWATIDCLDVFQLDPVESLRGAPFKPRQLQLARSLGLEIPRTLVTNRPEEVRAFARTCPNGVIMKLVDGSTLAIDRDAPDTHFYTRRLDDRDLDALGALRFSPMIFQEAVPKARELRITVVGQRAFVAAVDSSGSALGAADWRQDRSLASAFKPYDDCPPAVLDRIMALLSRLGLNFATIDVIVTPDGRHVFLELNTTSYFDFIERATDLPISAAIADLLLGLAPSRIPTRSPRR